MRMSAGLRFYFSVDEVSFLGRGTAKIDGSPQKRRSSSEKSSRRGLACACLSAKDSVARYRYYSMTVQHTQWKQGYNYYYRRSKYGKPKMKNTTRPFNTHRKEAKVFNRGPEGTFLSVFLL